MKTNYKVLYNPGLLHALPLLFCILSFVIFPSVVTPGHRFALNRLPWMYLFFVCAVERSCGWCDSNLQHNYYDTWLAHLKNVYSIFYVLLLGLWTNEHECAYLVIIISKQCLFCWFVNAVNPFESHLRQNNGLWVTVLFSTVTGTWKVSLVPVWFGYPN